MTISQRDLVLIDTCIWVYSIGTPLVMASCEKDPLQKKPPRNTLSKYKEFDQWGNQRCGNISAYAFTGGLKR
jgi:hypothetical protein